MSISRSGVPEVTNQLLNEMVAAVIEVVEPVQIILFGSRAKGTSRPDSDVDFLVVEAAPFGPERSRRREVARVWRALAKFGVPTDVLLYSVEEVAEWRDSPNHMIHRAIEDGQILYEQPQAG